MIMILSQIFYYNHKRNTLFSFSQTVISGGGGQFTLRGTLGALSKTGESHTFRVVAAPAKQW